MKTATEILIEAMEELSDSPDAKVMVIIDDAGEDGDQIRRLTNAPYTQGIGMLRFFLVRDEARALSTDEPG